MTSQWRWTAALAVAGAVAVVLLAEDSATFKVDVSVVNILASVRDRDGKIVSDLGKDDFVLEENGKGQEIRYFSRQTDLPMLVGLLVDTSLSQRRLIQNERDASYKFFEQVLRPENDTAFVIRFDTEVELLQDLTNSRPALEAALNDLEVKSPFGRTAGSGRSHFQGWPGGTTWPGGGTGWPGGRRRQPRPGGGGQRGPGGQHGRIKVGTALYDSVFLAADEVLRQKTGRKAIILISDGVDAGSKVSQSTAIEAAQRADAIVYSIRYYDSDAYAGRAISRRQPEFRWARHS